MWFDEVLMVRGALSIDPLDLGESQAFNKIGHPPLYFFLLRAWILFTGTSDFALHTLSVLATVAAGAFIYRVTADMSGGHFGGIAATVVFGSSGFVKFYAQQVHNYTLFLMLSAALLFVYYRWWTRRTNTNGQIK